MPFGKLCLALKQFADLGFHELLVKHLAAGDAIHLRTKRGDAVLIRLLQPRLTSGGRTDEVIPQDQV